MEGIGVVGGGGSDADGEELQAFEPSLRRRDRGRLVHGPELLDLKPALYSLGNAFALMRLRLYF
jgi:hypothetical protein